MTSVPSVLGLLHAALQGPVFLHLQLPAMFHSCWSFIASYLSGRGGGMGLAESWGCVAPPPQGQRFFCFTHPYHGGSSLPCPGLHWALPQASDQALT